MATVTSLKFDMKSTWDGKGFAEGRADIKAFNDELRRISGKHIRANVDAVLDDSDAREKLKKLAEERHIVTVKAKADVAEAKTELTDAAKNRKTTIGADADTRKAKEEIDGAARNRKSVLSLDADTGEAMEKINAAIAWVEATKGSAKIKLEANTDEAKQKLMAFKAWAEANGRKVSVTLDANTGKAEAAIAFTARDRRVNIKPKIDVSQMSTFEKLATRAAEGTLSTFEGIGRGVTGLGSALTNIVGKFRLALIGAIALAAVSLMPLIGQFVQAMGVIALMPAGLAAVGATLATLVIGASGVGDAFKAAFKAQDDAAKDAAQKAKDIASAQREVQAATRGVEAAQRNYAQAQRSVVSAQREVISANREVRDAEENVAEAQKTTLKAQRDLNKARKEATSDLTELNRQLKRASLDEEGAALAVAEARRDLMKTYADPGADPLDRAEAQHRLNEALADQEDTLAKNRELAQKAAEENQKGVEGSDKVVDAKDRLEKATDSERNANERLADAHERVADAQQRVVDAQQNVIDAQTHIAESQQNLADAQQRLADATNKGSESQEEFARKLAKLSPAAAAFVTQMMGMKSAYDDLKRSVQENLFQGLGDSFSTFANHWLPTIKKGLGDIATEINQGVRKALADMDTDANRSTMATIFDNIKKSIQPVIDGLKNIMEGFLNLAGVGSDFLPGLSNGFDDVSKRFKAWTDNPDNQQKFHNFIEKSLNAFGEFLNLIKQIGRVFGAVFKGSEEPGQNMLKGMADDAKRLADYLYTPEGQTKVKQFFEDVKQILHDTKTVVEDIWKIFDKIDHVTHGISGSHLFDVLGEGQKGFSGAAGLIGGDFSKKNFGDLAAGAGEALFGPFGPMIGKRIENDLPKIKSGFAEIGQIIHGEMTTAKVAWDSIWNGMKQGASNIWEETKAEWRAVTRYFGDQWDSVKNNLSAIWKLGWDSIKDAGKVIWDSIQLLFDTFLGAIKLTWEGIKAFFTGDWDKFWKSLKETASKIWDDVKQGFHDFADGVQHTLENLVHVASTVWDGIKGVFAKPINFVIDIWNNNIADHIGMKDKHIPRIEGYADGGPINGPGGGREDRVPAWLSHGEYVVNARAAFQHRDLLDAINYGANGLPKFQDGGDVSPAIGKALNWVAARNGEPYNADGWLDCSGLASALYDVVRGVEPKREFTTTADFQSLGFKPGVGGVFQIGVTPLPGNDGHMALTVGGHNIESGGSHNSIEIDGDAAGAYDSQFSDRYYLPGALFSPPFSGLGANGGEPGGGGGFFGRIGDAFSKVVNKGRELLSAMFTRLTDPLINAIPSPFAPGMGDPMGAFGKSAGTSMRDNITEWIRGHESRSPGQAGGGIGGTVPTGDRAAIIDEALKLTGTPPPGSRDEWQRGFNTLITRESGWNSAAINNWDSNAAQGFPTKGLTQMRDDTFSRYAVPGHTDIWNPVDNVASDVGYIKETYGGIGNVQQANENMDPHGYATGTTNAQQGWSWVGENGPELVKFHGGEQVWTIDDIVKRLQNAVTGPGGLQNRAAAAGGQFLQAQFDQFTSDLTGGSVGEGFFPQLFKQGIAYGQSLAAWQGPQQVHYHVDNQDELIRKQKQQQQLAALGFGPTM